jgi:hypothetical protein
MVIFRELDFLIQRELERYIELFIPVSPMTFAMLYKRKRVREKHIFSKRSKNILSMYSLHDVEMLIGSPRSASSQSQQWSYLRNYIFTKLHSYLDPSWAKFCHTIELNVSFNIVHFIFIDSQEFILIEIC